MAKPNISPPIAYPYGIGGAGTICVAQTNSLALPQTASKTIFTIQGGPIVVYRIFGIVTTNIGAVANNTRLRFTPSTNWSAAGAVVDISLAGAANITGLLAGSLIQAVTSFGTALNIADTGGIATVANTGAASQFMIVPGIIDVTCAGSDGGTGRVMWFMEYQSFSTGPVMPGDITIPAPGPASSGGIVVVMPTT